MYRFARARVSREPADGSARQPSSRAASGRDTAAGAHRSRRGRGKRILLGSAITVISINVWTGGPLLALWLAARLERGMFPTLAYIALVTALLAAISFVLLRLLALLGRAYERSLGRERRVRQHVPWLRSMRGERRTYSGDDRPVAAVDRVMVAAVTACVITFEVWFFLFAHQTLVGGGAR